ncbi:hypothetical protein F3Y22_tig00000773pilonHSYRG00158 [Hibiscus syriacus]|uniref:Uncharacterized protein n=1 Tax=Hibiscus syriacus TaxID=106335 RepID=A0A6A3D3B4_HIBSY|nr:hypothetical protein F3Y22_tig00000773pilonHSYRG00158 [Hibiscus syriacus]
MVEKRLKLEENQADSGHSSSTPSHVPETNPTPTQSLGTPLCLHLTYPSNTNVSNTVEDSEPPQAFICSSSSPVHRPKCEKEAERMEGWFRYFLRNGSEPLSLAFLLMRKAAFENGDDCGFQCLEFPSSIDEFLKIDPPKV